MPFHFVLVLSVAPQRLQLLLLALSAAAGGATESCESPLAGAPAGDVRW